MSTILKIVVEDIWHDGTSGILLDPWDRYNDEGCKKAVVYSKQLHLTMRDPEKTQLGEQCSL